MQELLRSNDAVFISYVVHELQERGVDCLVLDGHMSILEGSIGAIPRRVMVAEEHMALARTVLAEAEALRDI